MKVLRYASNILQQTAKLQCLQKQTQARALYLSAVKWNNIINIQDDEDFKKRVKDSEKPVIVDFHAVWCGPCKQLTPVLEEVAAEHEDDVMVAKVDIDQMPDIATNYGVQAVPTVLGIKKGEVVSKFTGVKPKSELADFVEDLIKA